MAPPKVPLKDLGAAVQSAVQQVLAQHGAVDVGHLWVGFVAPDAIATQANALKLAQELGREAGGLAVTPSVAQLSASPAAATGIGTGGPIIPSKGHLIGLIYSPAKVIK
jgi:hypothetical protein